MKLTSGCLFAHETNFWRNFTIPLWADYAHPLFAPDVHVYNDLYTPQCVAPERPEDEFGQEKR